MIIYVCFYSAYMLQTAFWSIQQEWLKLELFLTCLWQSPPINISGCQDVLIVLAFNSPKIQ